MTNGRKARTTADELAELFDLRQPCWTHRPRHCDYFTTRLPQRGIQPVQVAATYDAFVEALQNPGFDVLHVACHGDACGPTLDWK